MGCALRNNKGGRAGRGSRLKRSQVSSRLVQNSRFHSGLGKGRPIRAAASYRHSNRITMTTWASAQVQRMWWSASNKQGPWQKPQPPNPSGNDTDSAPGPIAPCDGRSEHCRLRRSAKPSMAVMRFRTHRTNLHLSLRMTPVLRPWFAKIHLIKRGPSPKSFPNHPPRQSSQHSI